MRESSSPTKSSLDPTSELATPVTHVGLLDSQTINPTLLYILLLIMVTPTSMGTLNNKIINLTTPP